MFVFSPEKEETCMKRPMHFLLLAIFGLAGCASNTARIYEGSDGSYVAKANEEDKAEALNEAAEGAEEFCEDSKKRAIFIKDETKYTGTMDEKAREVVRKAGDILGGPVKAMGKGSMASGKDYEAELSFKCN